MTNIFSKHDFKKKAVQFAKNPQVLLILFLALFELLHLRLLYGNADILAGGDNYVFLLLRKNELNPYIWDYSIPLGGNTYAIADLLGIQAYSYFFSFLTPQVIQKILIYSLYFFRYVGFLKLAKHISKKFSIFAILPAIFLYSFNAFASLDSFSLFPLAYAVYLPFSFLYFIKLFESKKFDYVNISKLVFLTILFSPISSNFPLAVTIFVPQILYMLFYFKELKKTRILNISVYYFLFFVVSLWWLLPQILFFLSSAEQVLGGKFFAPTTVGSYFLNFRFMGQWGWYGSHFLHLYYPFSTYYDHPLVLLVTYSIIIVSFYAGFKKINHSFANKDKTFFLFLALFSLFLVSGARSPLGFVYEFLFNTTLLFRVFREPFTKFMELYVLSISMLFYFFLLIVEKRVAFKKKPFIFGLVLVFIFINGKPTFLGEHVWDKWNGSMRTFRVEVPEYWEDFEAYINEMAIDTRILTLPKAYYGSSWSWPRGFSSADDVAINFVKSGNSIVRNPLAAGLPSAEVVEGAFTGEKLSKKYLSLLGIKYVLLENDLDWRYSGRYSLSPSQMDKFLENTSLKQIKEFGVFTEEYLVKIQNIDPNSNVRYEMNAELYNRPVLVMYEIEKDLIVPHVYASHDYIYSNGDPSDLRNIVDFDAFDLKDIVYFYSVKEDNDFLPPHEETIDNSKYIFLKSTQRKSSLVLDENLWNPGWLWPEANVNPIHIEYKLVNLKERFEELKTHRNFKKRVDLLTWYSAKRVVELSKFSSYSGVEPMLVDSYTKTIKKIILLTKGIPENERDRDYWEMVEKTLAYMRRNNDLLVKSVYIDENSEALILYDNFIEWIDVEASPFCSRYCFLVVAEDRGLYDVFVDKKTVIDPETVSLRIENVDDNKETVVDRSMSKERPNEVVSDKWLRVGTVSFDKDLTYRTNLYLPEDDNLLNDEEWLSYDGVSREESGLNLNPHGLGPPLKEAESNSSKEKKEKKSSQLVFSDNYVKYKTINEWVPHQKYKLSFDFNVSKGGLGIALVEDSPDYKDKYNKLLAGKSIVTNSIVKNVVYEKVFDAKSTILKKEKCDSRGVCLYNFEKIFNSSRDSVGASIYVFAFSNASEFSDIKIENVKITRVEEPQVLFVAKKNMEPRPQPLISFKKINPSMYKVEVEDANDAYTLLFNESFHKDWRLVHEGKNLASDKHYLANGYANGWMIEPEDVGGKQNYDLYIEYAPQKIFNVTLAVMLVFLAASSIRVLYYIVEKYVFDDKGKKVSHD